VSNPQNLLDFRPISLVGCLYKVLAKVLVNILRTVINSVIYEVQSAFVNDNFFIDDIAFATFANEVVDDATKNKKELIMFKVYFKKVYDSAE